MPYNPNIRHRRSIRLKGYDYSQAGLYFITICCDNRICLFGNVVNGEMELNDAGKIADACWMEIPNHFPNAVLHEHIVMPNHVHGIVELVGAKHFSPDMPDTPNASNTPNEYFPDNNRVKHFSPDMPDTSNTSNTSNEYFPDSNRAKGFSPLRSPSKTIGSVVRGFKIGVTKWFRNTMADDFPPQRQVWQRNYHEHIIRNEQSYQTISNYIINNPIKWADDKFYKQ
jgi:REP element-mobilizing transposase RayT